MTAPARGLRVLHATECLAAGTLYVLRSLVEVLARQGAEQTLVYSTRDETPDDVATLFVPGLRMIQVPRARGHHLRFIAGLAMTLRHECRTWRPQHVHLHSSKAGFVGRLLLAGQAQQTKVYYSPHGLSFLDPAAPLRNAVYRGLERLASLGHAVPVGCGQGEAHLLRRITGLPARLLENPVDDGYFELAPRGQRPRTVATVGRISRQKDPQTFAAMAQALRRDDPTLRAVWIGDGDAAGRQLLLDAGCQVTGWIDRAGVMDWMAQADVYVQTSLWEGLPLSVLQAMASGLPCVVRNVPGNRDTVRHGRTGFTIENLDELLHEVRRLLADDGLRLQIGSAARREARLRFSQAAFAAGVARLYGLDGMAAPRPPSRGGDPGLLLPGLGRSGAAG